MNAAPGSRPMRSLRERSIEDVVHDPYVEQGKPSGPAICPGCRLAFARGRWQRLARPVGAVDHLCPACRRIRDRQPAGYVTLKGAFVREHGDDLLRLVRNEEAREAKDHPLQRIMDIDRTDDALTITTTDVHLARRIGDAVTSAYDGRLTLKYSPAECLVRVHWER